MILHRIDENCVIEVANIQLGQPSVIPPDLCLKGGGDFNLAGSCAWRAEVPPYLEP